MAKVDRLSGPSSADVAKEVTILQAKGKADSNGKLLEWGNWKASLCQPQRTMEPGFRSRIR